MRCAHVDCHREALRVIRWRKAKAHAAVCDQHWDTGLRASMALGDHPPRFEWTELGVRWLEKGGGTCSP